MPDLVETEIRTAPDGLAAWVNSALHPFGCIDVPETSIPEAVTSILASEAWLRSMGCTHARGPMRGTTFLPYRAILGPMERPAFLGEPTTSAEAFIAAGYEPIAEYASAIADNQAQVHRGERDTRRLHRDGYRLETLDEVGGFDAALGHFYRITSDSFRTAFSYSPIDYTRFAEFYEPLRNRVDPRLVRLARAPDGEVVGYCLSLPDLLNPSLDQFIVKTLAVHPDYRRHRLGSVMVAAAHENAHAAGYTGGGIHALMWTQSHSRDISAHGGRIFRRYALYEKRL